MNQGGSGLPLPLQEYQQAQAQAAKTGSVQDLANMLAARRKAQPGQRVR